MNCSRRVERPLQIVVMSFKKIYISETEGWGVLKIVKTYMSTLVHVFLIGLFNLSF